MKELFKRTSYGLVFVVLVIGSILLSKYAFAALMLFVSLIGTYETLNLQQHRNLKLPLSQFVLLNNLFFYSVLSLVAVNFIATKFIVLILFPPILVPFIHALFSKANNFPTIVVAHWSSLLLVSLPSALLIFLYNSRFIGDIAGAQLIISILFMVWINDVFAYLVGVSIGRHRLFERISPKKKLGRQYGRIIFLR